MTLYRVYCSSYNNPARKEEMKERFSKVDIDITFLPGVSPDDPRIGPDRLNKKGDCVMYCHLDMLQEFLKGDAEFGILCEDDIYIRKTFKHDILIAIDGFKRLNLNVLLLGYLTGYYPCLSNVLFHTPLETPYAFLNVYKELWGTQMFMVSRESAKMMLERFSDPYKTEKTVYFASDWTLTKVERNACLYPMLAVEKIYPERGNSSDDRFHRQNEKLHYNSEFYF